MDITPLIPKGRKVIHAYGDGGFRIGEERYEGPVIVTPETVEKWNVGAEGFTEADFASVLALPEKPEILLIGTGSAMTILPAPIRNLLRSNGIVAEVMDTGAACRTYNVLMSEGRIVAAALKGI